MPWVVASTSVPAGETARDVGRPDAWTGPRCCHVKPRSRERYKLSGPLALPLAPRPGQTRNRALLLGAISWGPLAADGTRQIGVDGSAFETSCQSPLPTGPASSRPW